MSLCGVGINESTASNKSAIHLYSGADWSLDVDSNTFKAEP